MTGIREDIAIWTINDPSGLQGLNIEVSNNHPNIYKFIIDLRSEELLIHAKGTSVRGDTFPIRKTSSRELESSDQVHGSKIKSQARRESQKSIKSELENVKKFHKR